VDKKGYTRDVRVVASAPPGVFDRAATDAIARWRYRPAKYNGQPVEVPVRTHIVFKLPTN
jgi:protein TonB